MVVRLTSDQIQLQKMVVASEPSFPTSYAFNFLPSRYIHDSWLQYIFGEAYAEDLRSKIAKAPFADARLNQMILKKFGLLGQYCYDFDQFSRRLALMPNEDVVRIIKLIGMIPYMDSLKKVIAKADVEKIRASLGHEEYRFLVKRLPFLLPDRVLNFVQKLKVSPFDVNQIEVQSFKNGVNFLLFWIQDQPLAMSQRLRLKFKMNTEWELQESFKSLNLSDVQMIFRKIIREMLPAWRHLFV